MKPKKQKKPKNGFGLRLTMAIILFLAAAIWTLEIVVSGILYPTEDTEVIYELLPYLILAAGLWILAILQTIFAVAGKKHKGANVCSIILGIILLPTYVGVFALAGGIMGTYTYNTNRTESTDSASTAAATENVAVTPKRQEPPTPNHYEDRSVRSEIPTATTTENAAVTPEQQELSIPNHYEDRSVRSEIPTATTIENVAVTPEQQKSLDDYPIDYQNKPTVSPLFDRANSGRLILKTGDSDAPMSSTNYTSRCTTARPTCFATRSNSTQTKAR